MNIFRDYQQRIEAILVDMLARGELALRDTTLALDQLGITLTPPREASHGDLASNLAMVLAKPCGLAPRQIAELLRPKLQALEGVDEVTIAGPGFLNIRLSRQAWQDQLRGILRLGDAFGRSQLGQGHLLNVEFVSANPTGPLHVGHARGAVIGDVLARLLAFVGYQVTREYYVNDAGAQIDKLAASLFYRYRQLCGVETSETLPEGLYPGDYLIPVAEALKADHGDTLLQMEERERHRLFRLTAVNAMLALIRQDLALLNISFDRFSSEAELVDSGKVDELVASLTQRDLIYQGVIEPPKGKAPPDDWEPRPQMLFRASQFGDDSDRPLQKADGSWTYFASDIAYHFDKWQRGFTLQTDVWGADHAGYVTRMKAALAAISQHQARLDILMCQIVKFVEDGKALRMSKRAGNFVLLSELIQEVGADVVRFYLLTRRHDAPLDFDLAKVQEQSRDNPVFYAHYAHARCCSVFKQAVAMGLVHDGDVSNFDLAKADVSLLRNDDEWGLVRLMADWPRQIEAAAEAREPHRLAYFLHELASAFHALWTRGREEAHLRFLQENDREGNWARLALVGAVRQVLAQAMRLMGVEPLSELR